jgi:hypothetical protein
MIRRASRARRDRCAQWGRKLLLVLWISSLAACGPIAEEGRATQDVTRVDQWLRASGLSTNGLSVNGLSTNGLSIDGLSSHALDSAAFSSWFNQSPALSEVVMEYVVRCAVPKNRTLTYRNPVTARVYRWGGHLGLARDWSAGHPATEREQQAVSACLAAHVNKFGLHVPLSVLGRTARGKPVPYTARELERFSVREACFFGNVFNGTGVYAANDRPLLGSTESTSRACGLASQAQSTDCSPLAHVGFCSELCTLDATGTYYTRCTYQGSSFLPLTTRLEPAEIFRCGDGVCQFTEHCGTGTTPQSCGADCGACP